MGLLPSAYGHMSREAGHRLRPGDEIGSDAGACPGKSNVTPPPLSIIDFKTSATTKTGHQRGVLPSAVTCPEMSRHRRPGLWHGIGGIAAT